MRKERIQMTVESVLPFDCILFKLRGSCMIILSAKIDSILTFFQLDQTCFFVMVKVDQKSILKRKIADGSISRTAAGFWEPRVLSIGKEIM